MNLVITVPTYWRASNDQRGLYDHPTPLGEEGTLLRLLGSLAQDGTDAPIAVVVGGTNPDIAEAAEKQVQRMIAPYWKRIRIAVFGMAELRVLSDRISAHGFSPEAIGVVGYGKIRNLQLLIGALLGADAVVGLDDDEEVPSGYLARVQRFIGSEYEGEPVLGVVGPYREVDDHPIARSTNPLLERGRWIRNGISALAAAPEGELVDTPIGFGGNIVIHRDLFTQIPFDPYISRGEDVDYIVTCRMYGRRFWWDNGLVLHHFPPVWFRRPPCTMLRADVSRFIYSREKIALAVAHGLPAPEKIDPYPGRFLRDDLPALARAALTKACPDEFETEEKATRFVAAEMARARGFACEFFRIADEWRRLVAALEADKAAVEYTMGKLEANGEEYEKG